MEASDRRTLGTVLARASQPGYRALLVFGTGAELQRVRDMMHRFCVAAGGTWNAPTRVWRFPRGAVVEFVTVEQLANVQRFRNISYGDIIVGAGVADPALRLVGWERADPGEAFGFVYARGEPVEGKWEPIRQLAPACSVVANDVAPTIPVLGDALVHERGPSTMAELRVIELEDELRREKELTARLRRDVAELRAELDEQDFNDCHYALTAAGVSAGELLERIEDLIEDRDEALAKIVQVR